MCQIMDEALKQEADESRMRKKSHRGNAIET